MYFAEANRPRLRFRLEANQDIVSSAGFIAPNLVFITSIDGYVYCIDDNKQQVFWQASLGTPMSQSPVGVGEQVLVVTDEDELICLDAFSGKQVWGPTFNVSQLLSISETKIYAFDRRGDLVILDRETGSPQRTLRLNGSAIPFVNTQTDRLFLSNKQGLVVCVHEKQYEFPLIHVDLNDVVEAEGEDAEAAADDTTDDDAAAPPPKKDPFDGF